MKKFFLFMAASLIAVALLPLMSYGQSSLPADFKDKVQEEYDKIKHKETSFDRYYEIKMAEYEQIQYLKKNPLEVYNPLLGGVLAGPDNTCSGGDFENGLNPTFWRGGRGSIDLNGVIQYGNFQQGFMGGYITSANARHTVVDRAMDSILLSLGDTLWTTADTGSHHAVRLGNAATGAGAELIAKSFVVTPSNALIIFKYALVLENPNPNDHAPEDQPAFRVRIRNHTTGQLVDGLVNLGNDTSVAFADATNTQFFKVSDTIINHDGPVVFTNWNCAQINLTSLIDDSVTIEFVNNDCSQTGHFGYTYIDDFCSTCGADNPMGSINLGNSNTCGAGQICVNFTVPVAVDGTTGFVKPILRLFQNGVQIAWFPAQTYTSSGSHCFSIDPSALGITSNFDYVIEGLFMMSNGNLPTQFIGNTVTGQNGTVNDDYRVECPANQCCPGTNYIKNGTFSSLISTFTSGYTYQAPGAGAGSVGSGEYSVMTSAEASAISPTWIPGCPDYGRALIVNGATEMSTGPKMVWTQTSGTLTPGAYRFCVDLRNLPQCDFNAPSRVTVSFSGNGPGPIPFYGSSVITVGGNGCNWTTLIRNLNIPSGVTSLQVSISLTETVIGDGNDLAIDNINLTRLDTVSVAQAHFTHTTSNVNSSTYNITANATAALNAGCTRFWQVEEVTNTSTPNVYNVVPGTQVINPVAWQNINPNTFIGYNGTSTLSGSAPGVFQVGKLYRIFYSSDCPCMTRRMTFHIVTVVLRPGFPPTPIPVDSGVVDDPGDGGGQGRMAPGAGGNGISVFPNPTDNKVTVQMEPLQADAILKVLSLSGQELKSISVPANDTQVDLSLQELPAGMYLLQMTSRTGEKLLNYKISKL